MGYDHSVAGRWLKDVATKLAERRSHGTGEFPLNGLLCLKGIAESKT